jgi:hypothetical protein
MPRTRKPSINHTEPKTQTINHTEETVMIEEPVTVQELPEQTVIVTDKGKEITVGEVKHSNRLIKSTTPKGDLSWYIKWASSLIVLVAISFRTVYDPKVPETAWMHHIDIIGSWLGAIGWCLVGMLWKDRALILLNGVIGIILFTAVIKIFAGV